MAKVHVHATINGEPVEFLTAPHETLLTALRDALGLTGTKEGCATGDCGACSVIMNGRLVPSCLVLAAEAEGNAVVTIEGIGERGILHRDPTASQAVGSRLNRGIRHPSRMPARQRRPRSNGLIRRRPNG